MSKSQQKSAAKSVNPSKASAEELAKAADKLTEKGQSEAFQEAVKPVEQPKSPLATLKETTALSAPQKPSENGSPGMGDNQYRINWEPQAKDAAEFNKMASDLGTEVGTLVHELETNATAKLARLTCDFIALNNRGAFDQTHDASGKALPTPIKTERFDPSDEDIAKKVRAALRPIIFPDEETKGQTEAQKKLIGFSSANKVSSLRALFPMAVNKGVLVLMGEAEIGWTLRSHRYTAKAAVIRETELPKGDEAKQYVRCIAAPWSRIMPMVKERDPMTGNVLNARPNMDHRLILLTSDLTNLLYALHYVKGAKRPITGESGWLEMPKGKRAANSGQGATTNGASNGGSQLQKSDANVFAKAFIDKLADTKADTTPGEIVAVARATAAAIDKVRGRYRDGKMPSALAYALGELFNQVTAAVETEEEKGKEIVWTLDENGRRSQKYVVIDTPVKQVA